MYSYQNYIKTREKLKNKEKIDLSLGTTKIAKT